VKRSRDNQNWPGSHWVEISPLTELTADRSLEDIGARSLALLEKGKVARAFDKTQDAQEVIGLVESLRQAILIYQVSVRRHQSRKTLTLGTGVTTTVNIQPGRPFDREPLLPFSVHRLRDLMIGWSIQGILRYTFGTASGKTAVCDLQRRVTRFQTPSGKNKIEAVRARLDRLGAEWCTVMNGDEFRRRRNLFGCALFIHCEILHFNAFSELSRGSRTNWNFYLNDPLVIRRGKGTRPPRMISWTTSGMR